MRSIIRLSIALCFLVTAQATAAQEYDPITGAFGWEFGQIMDPPPQAERKYRPGPASYEGYFGVTPPKPIPYCSKYNLSLDPELLQVLGMDCEGSFPTPEAGTTAFEELAAILTEKYGPNQAEAPQSYRAGDDETSVRLNAVGTSLTLEYIHYTLARETLERLEQQHQESIKNSL